MSETPDGGTKEALQYWGYLFEDRCGTDVLHRLLRGIAGFITATIEPSDSPDLTPTQLSHFYRSVNGDYDALFLGTPPSSIAYIYKSLGCLHSLQPSPNSNGYSEPYIPALKPQGFVTWQTLQLLLAPEAHVPFLQEAVRKWDITDPKTGATFPKLLPKESFPTKPDQPMIKRYEGVSERLRKEAEKESVTGRASDAEEHSQRVGRYSSEISNDGSVNERTDAASYFANPLYRNHEGRPGIVRRWSKNPKPPRSPRILERGKVVAMTVGNTVRNVWSPHLWNGHGNSHSHNHNDHRRHSSLPGGHHHSEHDETEYNDGDDGPTPTAHHARHSPHRQSSQLRQTSHIDHHRSSSSTSSESEPRSPRHHARTIRHRRSHDPPPSPRDYFPPYDPAQGRRFSAVDYSGSGSSGAADYARPAYAQAGFGPSESPLFATRVARGEVPAVYYQHRPAMHRSSPQEWYPGRERKDSGRGGGGGGGGGGVGGGGGGGGGGGRGEYGDREGEVDRGGARPRAHRYVTPVDGVGGRRYPIDAPWR